MNEANAVIQDLQQSLDRCRVECDQWKAIAYSLASYEANAAECDVETVIRDERNWIEYQARMREAGIND